MSGDQNNEKRLARLHKLFSDTIHGKREVKNPSTAKLFLEAICAQEDAATCVETLIASSAGISSLQSSLKSNISTDFLNDTTSPVISYLVDQKVRRIHNGQYLTTILKLIFDPPTIWRGFLSCYRDRTLNTSSLYSFALLLSESLSLPEICSSEIKRDAVEVVSNELLLQSPEHELRTLHHRIKNILDTLNVAPANSDFAAGGRHDNDFPDFREIAIYPTADEFLSTETPFYRQADALYEVDFDMRASVHLDNQFRLLREDLLAQLREGLQVATGRKKGRRSGLILQNVAAAWIFSGDHDKRKPCTIMIQCQAGLEQLTRLPVENRKAFLKSNRNFLKHQSFGCLVAGDDIVAFATLSRVDDDNLLKNPPLVHLQILGDKAFRKALIVLNQQQEVHFVLVETPFFAYEPILKCLQEKTELPFKNELFDPENATGVDTSSMFPDVILRQIRACHDSDIQHALRLSREVILEGSQMNSLISGLEKSVSLIQGPPGTGKSFIGAIIAKAMYEYTNEKILVISFTNHALDQFLEDLIDIGIPAGRMVRLGFKHTSRTYSLRLSEQQHLARKTSRDRWNIIESFKATATQLTEDLQRAFRVYRDFKISYEDFLEYLQFSEDEQQFFEALHTPEEANDMTRVGSKGKGIGPSYLFDRWSQGFDAGIFKDEISQENQSVWSIETAMRKTLLQKWTQTILEDHVANVCDLKKRLDFYQKALQQSLSERSSSILEQKRIVGCTTTGAATHAELIQTVSPGAVLVEEAGEILECHVLTALSESTKKLIMIGDHKQLRPRVSNYALSVEKGDGFDLNVSMFERLVLAGYPTTTLSEQHRMSPKISSIVRHLTYPDLQDAQKTKLYSHPRGLQDRVIFLNHEHQENILNHIADRRDQGAKSSKQNTFEAEMALSIVKFLAQQGYGTDQLVVLTPYLGQLHLLQKRLSETTDPVLNDLDSYDLVQAGLMTAAAAKTSKQSIRLSTIDNYQGEESDIAICSLTRGNESADIGFMAEPQRLNVLLSRARIALIIIGNAHTFQTSRKGKTTWAPFFEYITEHHHMYDGLPVQCLQHPHKKAIIQNSGDFDRICPDGGCDQACGVKLNCGLHECPSRCHQIADHSMMQCEYVIATVCPRNHKKSRLCHQTDGACKTCQHEDLRATKKQQRDHRLEMERLRRQHVYEEARRNIQDKIEDERRLMRDEKEQAGQKTALGQLKVDLENARKLRERMAVKTTSHTSQAPPKAVNDDDISTFSDRDNKTNKGQGFEHAVPSSLDPPSFEWKRQKDEEGAKNEALDKLMEMIGLENVKTKFLSIKAKIDTAIRQNVNLKDENFSAALLGNPGTGKTTVARLYAKFLTSVGALPGDVFVETTGSGLANDGVARCVKLLEDIQEKGGGVLFIDEAYQLSSGSNYGGKQVMDYLLAEAENLKGKVVFVIAGYNKQMETFFAHNPGIPSRFPESLQFADYQDAELRLILEHQINQRYSGHMLVEDGFSGLYARIVARRVGRGRGKEGFGNARAMKNVFSQITERQSSRLGSQRIAGSKPNDMLLTRGDLIGPEPSGALKNCDAWVKLQDLIGLSDVKDAVQALVDSIQFNYERELEEAPIMDFTLNRIFLGSPGTGKTSVAKLYGQILAQIGLLSNGEVVIKNPSDFMGSVIGESEKLTKGILASTVGKVLIIDEAYGLYGDTSSNGSGAASNQFKTAVIDTIVAEVQSTPGDDRCVLLLGYKDQMEEMFQKVNPGLMRRFPLSSAFTFADYTDEEMSSIFDLKMKQIGFKTGALGKTTALEILKRARNRPNFGNAGEVDILLNTAKVNFQQRRSKTKSKKGAIFEPEDFDKEFDRGKQAQTNVKILFKDDVGNSDIVTQLEGYQKAFQNAKNLGLDPAEHIPFNFLFRGPPGTGKTTTARKMGKVYYDMGFLSSAEVLEKSATDMVGQYIGQTGPKTIQLLEKALGKVLLIDEAYRLAEGSFAKEAMDEIVDCVTKPKFARKLIIILAGYDADINRLMTINPGLTSRFPASMSFAALSPADSLALLTKLLEKQKTKLVQKQKGDLDLSCLYGSSPQYGPRVEALFANLSQTPNWANARDVHTLAVNIFGRILRSDQGTSGTFVLDENSVQIELEAMLQERLHRSQSTNQSGPPHHGLEMQGDLPIQLASPPAARTSQVHSPNAQAEDIHKHEDAEVNSQPALLESQPVSQHRDSGVSDEVWEGLQRDIAHAKAKSQGYIHLLQQIKQTKKQVSASESTESTSSSTSESATASAGKPNNEDDEEKRRREQERLHRLKQRQALLEQLAELESQRKAEEERKKQEKKAQEKLRAMGVCPVGYAWIKQPSGYRCAGGSHFVGDAELGL